MDMQNSRTCRPVTHMRSTVAELNEPHLYIRSCEFHPIHCTLDAWPTHVPIPSASVVLDFATAQLRIYFASRQGSCATLSRVAPSQAPPECVSGALLVVLTTARARSASRLTRLRAVIEIQPDEPQLAKIHGKMIRQTREMRRLILAPLIVGELRQRSFRHRHNLCEHAKWACVQYPLQGSAWGCSVH